MEREIDGVQVPENWAMFSDEGNKLVEQQAQQFVSAIEDGEDPYQAARDFFAWYH